ncbi:GNAT family N-acetyltransferase [Tenacibaculum amylolyticum]|uniref:GNAT family N-acetyltransferase n=1 Tax=Tenacibaculum amylolyticum TaxID=104269 RepID=UPI003893D161
MNLKVREIQEEDVNNLLDYWYTANENHLKKMGADIQKLPKRETFYNTLMNQIVAQIEKKQSYVLIWEENGRSIGHTNATNIVFKKEAFMHLHVWETENRKKGSGTLLVKKSLPFYFEKLQLETLYCQPYALNPAPNKTLQKVGFEFVKKYTTIPGAINFEQEVKLWKMTKERFLKL